LNKTVLDNISSSATKKVLDTGIEITLRPKSSIFEKYTLFSNLNIEKHGSFTSILFENKSFKPKKKKLH